MRRELRMIVATVALGVVAGCQQKEGSTPPPAAGTPQAAPAPAATDKAAAEGDVLATYAGNRMGSVKVVKEMERLPAPSRAYLQAPDRKRQFVENLILNDLLF